jgi:hypothetical protein
VRSLAGLCGAASIAAVLPAAGQRAPSLDEVLARSGAYSIEAGRQLAAVVADEDYLQALALRSNGQVFTKRRLESEMVFVTLDDQHWLAFRRVRQVDGKDVGGDPTWLDQVFRGGPASVVERTRLIAAESARHNLGDVQRTVNFPTVVQQFLLPVHRTAFRFSKKREEQVGTERVWVIEYKERSHNTIITTTNLKSLPSEGLLWIEPVSGRLLRATLELGKPVPTEIEFFWRFDSRLGLWVPAEMRERYQTRLTQRIEPLKTSVPYDIVGSATYTNYRRFQADFRIK